MDKEGISKRGLTKKESHLNNFFSKKIVLGIIIVVLLTILLMFFIKIKFKTITCGDGTPTLSCSESKPYYCSGEVLIEKASLCGCPFGFTLEGDSCISPYQGNSSAISLKYILRGEEGEINFTVYQEMADYVSEISREIDYSKGEAPKREDFKLKKIGEENQRQLIVPLVVEIQNLGEDKEEQIRIAISIIQNIEWGFSNKTISDFGNFEVNHSRYPYEVLFDSQGICGEKSELLALLLKELGFEVALFYNQLENHESLGIKCPEKYSWKNTGYCFVETTGPSIFTDSKIEYVDGFTLSSEPEVMLISNGSSLGRRLYEYRDAKDLMKIRSKGTINYFDREKLKDLERKYGLVDEYNSG
jgi:hypothetical protein